MKLQSLEDLLESQLKDLYSAENQLVKALPKMAKAASSPELRKGFDGTPRTDRAATSNAWNRFARNWASRRRARSARRWKA